MLCSILFATDIISDSEFVFLLSSLSTMYKVRALALSCINYGGYKLYPYPLEDLSNLLMMKVKFCSLALCSFMCCIDLDIYVWSSTMCDQPCVL